MAAASTARDPEAPFQIAVLGDFRGRTNRSLGENGTELAGRRPQKIDRDNYDEVMAALKVELHLALPGAEHTPIRLRFRELDDFHPDRIYQQTEAFQALREIRRKLDDPATFEVTARQIGANLGSGPPVAVPKPTSQAPASPAENLLEQILEETRGRPASSAPVAEAGPWAAFLERITAPSRVAQTHPQQAELVASVDTTIAELMRSILHHPDFQALEAAWRALFFLVRRLETDQQLTISLLDVSPAELAADLIGADNLSATGTYKLLASRSPWAVLIGCMSFEPSPSDTALLDRLATLARQAGAPFLAAASPRSLGCDSLALTPDPDEWRTAADEPERRDVWEALRRHPDAAYLGLALPRFLLRRPYGRDGDSIESFAFEELDDTADHESLLWGNPAFLLAELLGRSFQQSGWEMQPGEINQVDDLPISVIRRDGESQMIPCSELVLSERAARIILDRGLMPVLSLRDRDIVRVGRFQSIAEPYAPLAGRWTS